MWNESCGREDWRHEVRSLSDEELSLAKNKINGFFHKCFL